MPLNAEAFDQRLQEYIASIREAGSHDARRLRFLDWAREAFDIDLAQVLVEERVFKGRVDALLGNLVFEFKTSLQRELRDAEEGLKRYIASLHATYPNATYTGVATDGLKFMVYCPRYSTDGSEVQGLELLTELDLVATPPEDVRFRLDTLLSHFRATHVLATTQSVLAGLGPASASFRTAQIGLAKLLAAARDDPAVAVRFNEWRRYLAIVYGDEVGDEGLYVKHTYLAVLARLMAFFRLEDRAALSPGSELEGVIRGGYFTYRAALPNFIEEDFFTWFLSPSVHGGGLALLEKLRNTLSAYDFSSVAEDVLKGLYEVLVDPEARHDLGEFYTPDWLAEYILSQELKLEENPYRSVLDPACGSGTFLFIAIRLMRQALERQGLESYQILDHILANVVGTDVHPLAVMIARTNYLLALGDLLQGPHQDVSIPVYLADSIRLPEVGKALASSKEEGAYTIPTGEPKVALQLPESLALNPQGLDSALYHMQGEYMGAIRDARTPEQVKRAESALYNFLTAPETPRKPFALRGYAAEVMVDTFKTLARLAREGKDTVWFFILRNGVRPAFLSRRPFDLVVGNPPWLSLRYVRNPRYAQWVRGQIVQDYMLVHQPGSGRTYLYSQMELATLFFARAADLYLKKGGTIAFVMPRSVMVAQQHARFTSFSFHRHSERSEESRPSISFKLTKILDLEGVSPLFNVPTCVLVAQKGQETTYPVEGLVFKGDLPARNASWSEASQRLGIIEVSLNRVEGRIQLQRAGPALAAGKSYYYGRFYQGAILVPRNMWFVRLVAGPLGFSGEAPYLETDEEQAVQAKPPWKDVRMRGNVESRFLFATLLSTDLVPFGHIRLRPVVLPLLEEGGRYTLLSWESAQERGFSYVARWLREAQAIWEAGARHDESGGLRHPSIAQRLDYLHNLTRQSPGAKYRVLYNKSGTNLCATTLAPEASLFLEAWQGQFPLTAFIADHVTYIYEAESQDEAHFLDAILNSNVLDQVIKPSQTRGQWGERDIHKRPLQFPIPRFDSANPLHARLAQLGLECAGRVKEFLPALASRYRSIGKIRGEVRRLLGPQLGEIDALVRELLGLAKE